MSIRFVYRSHLKHVKITCLVLQSHQQIECVKIMKKKNVIHFTVFKFSKDNPDWGMCGPKSSVQCFRKAALSLPMHQTSLFLCPSIHENNYFSKLFSKIDPLDLKFNLNVCSLSIHLWLSQDSPYLRVSSLQHGSLIPADSRCIPKPLE